MSNVFTRMSSVCHSYVIHMPLVCHPYVTGMYSYVIRMSLVCTRLSFEFNQLLSSWNQDILQPNKLAKLFWVC